MPGQVKYYYRFIIFLGARSFIYTVVNIVILTTR
jgi:hypothetical protein